MGNSYLLLESNTNGYIHYSLDIITYLSIFCGILVIVSKNPIVSVLYLIGLFLFISIYLMLLGLNFIGLSYLLVYVGAVSILFLFILMLINVRVSELTTDSSNSIPLAIMTGIICTISIYNLLPSNNITPDLFKNKEKQEIINFVTSQRWDGNLIEFSHISTIGNVIYTNYPIWLILTSIILLLAMVGAIVITIKK